jgi:bla regulator protein BlaR1
MNYTLVVDLIINSSIMSALLIILMLMAKWILNKRISAKWHYIIWFALLLRLAVPYMACSPINLSDLNTKTVIESSSSGEAEIQASQNIPSVIAQVYSAIGNTLDKLITYIGSIHLDYMIAFQVWILGVLILSLYSFVYNLLFWAKVKNGTVFTEQSIIKLLEESKEQLGIQTSISIIQTSGISIPAIFGVTRPWLLIPEKVLESMGHESLRYVILHELAHLKRRDIIVNWTALVLQVIHWFNPLVWLAFRKMRSDREMACDEAVLMHLKPKEVLQYGHTLLDMVEIISGRMRYAGIAGILEEKSQIKIRIQKISQFDKKRAKLPVLAIILTVIMGSSIVVNANNLTDFSKPQINDNSHLTDPVKNDVRDLDANISNTPTIKINNSVKESTPEEDPPVKPALSPGENPGNKSEANSGAKPEVKTKTAAAKTDTNTSAKMNTGAKNRTNTGTSTKGAIQTPSVSSGKQDNPQPSDTDAQFAEPFEEDADQGTTNNSNESAEEGIIDISNQPPQ